MNKNKTTLLIDADVLAFEAAVVAEEPIEWKDEMWTVHADMALAKARVVNRVEEFKDMMKTNKVTMCLTDRGNFRRVLNPDYKANRSKSRLPIILRQVKQWIIEELDGQMWANLEADDIISILATDKEMDEETIIVSIDKGPNFLLNARGAPLAHPIRVHRLARPKHLGRVKLRWRRGCPPEPQTQRERGTAAARQPRQSAAGQ